jgi:hypothetical protein
MLGIVTARRAWGVLGGCDEQDQLQRLSSHLRDRSGSDVAAPPVHLRLRLNPEETRLVAERPLLAQPSRRAVVGKWSEATCIRRMADRRSLALTAASP